jgi:hypothetical protein
MSRSVLGGLPCLLARFWNVNTREPTLTFMSVVLPARAHERMETWLVVREPPRGLTSLVTAALPGVLAVAGLDASRFHWSGVRPPTLSVCAAISFPPSFEQAPLRTAEVDTPGCPLPTFPCS